MGSSAKQCYHCQGLGHVQADCPTLRLNGGANGGGRCYNCNQPGHLAVSHLHPHSRQKEREKRPNICSLSEIALHLEHNPELAQAFLLPAAEGLMRLSVAVIPDTLGRPPAINAVVQTTSPGTARRKL